MPYALGSAYGKIVIATASIVEGLQSAKTALTGFESHARRIGQAMSGIGDQMTRGLTLPIAAVGVVIGKMAMDFQASMQQIVGLVNVSQQQVDQWSVELQTLGPKLGRGPKELADSLYFVTSAGIMGAAALDVVTKSAMAASAGLGETKVVADTVSSVLVAYGGKNITAGKAVGILVAAVREGKAEASEFAPVLGRVIPVAAQLGIRFDEVGAAMASMTRVGFDAAESATNLSGIMTAVLKPSKQAADELKRFGLSGEGLRETLKEHGLLAVLSLLKDTIGQDDEALAHIFPNVRGFRGILSLVGENAESTRQVFKSLASATEEDLNHAFEVASQTAKFKFNQSVSEVQSSLIKLGEGVLPVVIPVLQDLAKTIQGVASWFSSLSDAVKQTVVQILLLVAAIGPVLAIVGRLITGVGALVGLLISLGTTVASVVKGVGSFVKTGFEMAQYLQQAGFFTTSLVLKLGLLGAGLVVIAKFIEQAGVAAHATNEELVAMAHSGDLFKQAGASFELIANGSKRLRDVFLIHQDDMRKKLLDGKVTLEDYNTEVERSARIANVWSDKQNIAGNVVGNIVDPAVKQLTRSELDLLRAQTSNVGVIDETRRAQLRQTVALDASANAMDDATKQALEYADAQNRLEADQAAANVMLEKLRTLLDGPVGSATKDYTGQLGTLKNKQTELLAELAKLEASDGRSVVGKKKNTLSTDELALAQDNARVGQEKLTAAQNTYNEAVARGGVYEERKKKGKSKKETVFIPLDEARLAALNRGVLQAQVGFEHATEKIGGATAATTNYVDNSKRIGEVKGQLADLNVALDANANEFDKRLQRILLDMATEQLAANGLTTEEVLALTDVAQKFGLLDAATANATINAANAVDRFVKSGGKDIQGFSKDMQAAFVDAKQVAQDSVDGIDQSAQAAHDAMAGIMGDVSNVAADTSNKVTTFLDSTNASILNASRSTQTAHNAIVGVMGDVGNVAASIPNAVAGSLHGAGESIAAAGSQIKEQWQEVENATTTAATTMQGALLGATTDFITAGGHIQEQWQEVSTTAAEQATGVVTATETMVGGIQTAANGMGSALQPVTTAFDTTKTTVETRVREIIAKVLEMVSTITGIKINIPMPNMPNVPVGPEPHDSRQAGSAPATPAVPTPVTGAFQHGGRFIVRGPEGIDKVRVAFMATAGETVTVASKGSAQATQAGKQTNVNYYGDTIINDRLAAAMYLDRRRRDRLAVIEGNM